MPPAPTKVGWWDVETPQDACAAGRVERLGKESDPVATGTSGKQFVPRADARTVDHWRRPGSAVE